MKSLWKIIITSPIYLITFSLYCTTSFQELNNTQLDLQSVIHNLFMRVHTSNFHLDEVENIIQTLLQAKPKEQAFIEQLTNEEYDFLTQQAERAITEPPQQLNQLIDNGFLYDKILFCQGYRCFLKKYFIEAIQHLSKIFEKKPSYLKTKNFSIEDYRALTLQIFIFIKDYYSEYFNQLPDTLQEYITTTLSCHQPFFDNLVLYSQEEGKKYIPISEKNVSQLHNLTALYGPNNLLLADYYIYQKKYTQALPYIVYALLLKEWKAIPLLYTNKSNLSGLISCQDADKIARTLMFYLEKKDKKYNNESQEIMLLCAEKYSVAACCYLMSQSYPNAFNLLIKACQYESSSLIVPTLKKYNSFFPNIPLEQQTSPESFLWWMLFQVVKSPFSNTLTFNPPRLHTSLFIKPEIHTLIKAGLSEHINFICSDQNLDTISRYKKQIQHGFTACVTIRWVNNTIGFGLFAAEAIERGSMIAEYIGILVEAGSQDYSEYLLAYPIKQLQIDQGQDVWNISRFINHSDTANTDYVTVCFDNVFHIIIVANRHIKTGEEIFSNYGKNYWQCKDPINSI